REDAPLLEVETDKARVEIPSPMSGRVEKIHVQAGQTVKVGQVLVSFGGASATPGTKTAPTDGRAPSTAPPGAARQIQPSVGTVRVRDGPGPAAAAARRLGVGLRTVAGRGSGGRATDDDVRAAASGAKRPAAVPARATAAPERPEPARPAAERGPAKPLATVGLQAPPLPSFEQWGPVERQPLSHLRRTIAERMTLSATVIPHVTHFDKADI